MNAENQAAILSSRRADSADTNINTSTSVKKFRFYSIDILRGLVIVLMALDHVRDFWGMTHFNVESLDDSNLAWFLTRWVTHFCAPIFVFLAGTSIYFQQKMGKTRPELVRFLLTRGVWLIFLEFTFITLSWRFPVLPDTYTFQVIWILGFCMILMAGLIYLPKSLLLGVAVLIVLGHNAFDSTVGLGHWWTILHQGGIIRWEALQVNLFVLYPLLPWPAVMILGYLLGAIYLPSTQVDQEAHKKQLPISLFKMGAACLIVFVLMRVFGMYGDPNTFQVLNELQISIMSFLKVQKYPPSLHYLLVTLGGCLVLLAVFETIENRVTRFFLVFGQVPMFFYLLHIPLINMTSQLWTKWQFGEFYNLSMAPIIKVYPPDYSGSLLRTYLVWMCVIAIFYVACKAYGKFRAARPHQWWWRYL